MSFYYAILAIVLISNVYVYGEESDEDGPVEVIVYYESMCPFSRDFFTKELRDAINGLGDELNVITYPYGNAQTITKNTRTEFKCQHGPEECYGNKLHACAIENISNKTEAVLFNACLMDFSYGKGSNDATADKCGKSMNIKSHPIKLCAKTSKGTELLKQNGKKNSEAKVPYAPYILVDGDVTNKYAFKRDVCAAVADSSDFAYCKNK